MKKVMVLMGGLSSEKEISLLSGKAVAKALQKKGYKVIPYKLGNKISDFIQKVKEEKPNVVFNALHGKYGEDGCIQGLLNILKIPYTHSGVMASGIGMNKAMTRDIVSKNKIEVANGGLKTKEEFIKSPIKKPYVIKPNADGSSVGVFIVRTEKEEKNALKGWKEGQRLIEEYIPGRELSVAVLDGKALGIVEIKPKKGYYDYKNKYTKGAAEHIIPAKIPKQVMKTLCSQAEKVHRILGCRGVSRSDFRLDGERIVFLEINTNPGMTNLSLVPEIARICKNMIYEDLVAYLVEEAQCDA